MATIEKHPAPGPWAVDADTYHADTLAVSHSQLKVFRQSWRLYHGRYLEGTIPHPEPTPAMRLGTLLHMAVLEPERWESAVLEPKCDRRTKDGKAEWKAFCELSDGKLTFTIEEHNLVASMLMGISDNPTARDFLTEREGPTEHAIVWQDHETGLMCKAMRDKVLPEVILDLKTAAAAAPRQFASQALTLSYHSQAAWYLDGHKAVTGETARFAFIVVQSSPPFECVVYELDNDALDLGRRTNRHALFSMADCLDRDDWTAPWERGVNLLSLPRWSKYEDEYAMVD